MPLFGNDARYRLVPQLRDVENQPYEWRAYIMRQGSSNFRSASLNTDDCGFRVSIAAGQQITLNEFHEATDVKKGIVTGNSSIFGVGTTCDAATLPNRLNSRHAATGLWYNLGLRASNLIQERLTTELYAPKQLEYLVWISAGNDIVATLLDEGGNEYSPPFIGEPNYLKNMNRGNSFKQPGCRTFEEKFRLMLSGVEREISLVGMYRRLLGTRVLFGIQPMLSWIDKALSEEEKQLIDHFDSVANNIHRVHAPSLMRPIYTDYSHAIEKICRENGIDFIDFNSLPEFRKGDWLFIDRIHITDQAHMIMADTIAAWCESTSQKKPAKSGSL